MSNNNNIIVFDLETTSKFEHEAQILQIGAVAICGRTLNVLDRFQNYVRIDNLDLITAEITKVNGITREICEAATHENVVLPQFFEWTGRYNSRKNGDEWGLPIAAGYNIDNYDLPIISRYAQHYKYWNEKAGRQKVFAPVFTLDVIKFVAAATRTNSEVKSISLPNILLHMGMPPEEIEKNAHNGVWDAEQTAMILIKFLKLFQWLTEPRDDGTRRLELKNCLLKQG